MCIIFRFYRQGCNYSVFSTIKRIQSKSVLLSTFIKTNKRTKCYDILNTSPNYKIGMCDTPTRSDIHIHHVQHLQSVIQLKIIYKM